MTDHRHIREALEYLSSMVTERRLNRMRQVLSRRTFHLTVVLEDIYQAHNASAVMRSCDCLGIQQIHFIEDKNTMKVNAEVALGAEKWLSVERWTALNGGNAACLSHLKEKGYRIVVTSPHHEAYTPENIPLDVPLALVFGTEKEGVSDFWMKHADCFLKIPMVGFTESFNISVSAALILYTLTQRIDFREFREPDPSQTDEILLRWLTVSIPDGKEILKKFFSEKGYSFKIQE